MMAKRLWVAEVSFSFVVEAESEAEASEVAVENAREEIRNRLFLHSIIRGVSPLNSRSQLPDEWDGGCIPWGSEDDRTCAQVLAEQEGA